MAAGGEGQQRQRGRVATVDMDLEFALGRARVADANLGRIRADLEVERQGGDGGNDARACSTDRRRDRSSKGS